MVRNTYTKNGILQSFLVDSIIQFLFDGFRDFEYELHSNWPFQEVISNRRKLPKIQQL